MANPEVAYEHSGSAGITTLASSIDDSVTTIVGTDLSGWPTGAGGDFWITIDPEQPEEERILCSGRVGNTLTVATSGRGADSTVARNHASGATMHHTWSATEADQLSAHVSATSGVHGVTGDVVGTTDAQTLTNKNLDATDNTITGLVIADITGLQTALDGRATDAELASEASTRAAADTALDTAKQDVSEKGQVDGYASLDSSGDVPIAQLPTGTGGSQVALGNHDHDADYLLTEEAYSDTSLTARTFGGAETATPRSLAVTSSLPAGQYLILANCRGVTQDTAQETRLHWYLEASAGTFRAPEVQNQSDGTALQAGVMLQGYLDTSVSSVITFYVEKANAGAVVDTSTTGFLVAVKIGA